MKLNDQKNYLDQMKWTNCMRRCNKEKQMQEELMSLKTENKLLKKEVDNLADGIGIISKQLKEAYREIDYMKKHFIPINE